MLHRVLLQLLHNRRNGAHPGLQLRLVFPDQIAVLRIVRQLFAHRLLACVRKVLVGIDQYQVFLFDLTDEILDLFVCGLVVVIVDISLVNGCCQGCLAEQIEEIEVLLPVDPLGKLVCTVEI